jgi:hypothetical protein
MESNLDLRSFMFAAVPVQTDQVIKPAHRFTNGVFEADPMLCRLVHPVWRRSGEHQATTLSYKDLLFQVDAADCTIG